MLWASAFAGVNDLDGGGLGDAIRDSPATDGPAVFCCCLFFNCTQRKCYASISSSFTVARSRTIARARAAFAAAGVMHATYVICSLLPRSPRKQTRPSESNNGPQNRTCSPWTALWAWTRDIVTAIAGIACDMSAGHAVRRVGRAARRMHLRYHIWCGNEAARSGSIDATEAAPCSLSALAAVFLSLAALCFRRS